jgi:hypothetical protein
MGEVRSVDIVGVSVKLLSTMIERVDRVAASIRRGLPVSMRSRITRSHVIREALDQGLKALEAKYSD